VQAGSPPTPTRGRQSKKLVFRGTYDVPLKFDTPRGTQLRGGTEDQPIEFSRFRLVHLRHEVPVAVGRRLDRGVAELGLDVLRMSPLRDQETRVRMPQIVKPDPPELGPA
jgi:hypothetical protein